MNQSETEFTQASQDAAQKAQGASVRRSQDPGADRRKLLERLQAKQSSGNKSYPLSYVQRSMWFMDQLEPDTPLYNVPLAGRLQGRLDEAALWRAFREIVARHESLRTIFPTRNGVAVQEVLETCPSFEERIDLRALTPLDREAALKQKLREHSSRPFQLATGPLFRATLFLLGEEDHALFLNLHHIISDGWSVSIIQQEFNTLYQHYVSGGTSSPLPPPGPTYGDYTLWQRGWLKGDALERQLAFWRRELTDVADTGLPTDHPRPSVLVHHSGRNIDVVYPQELSEGIYRLCRQEGLTPFMVFLAAYELAIARYLGSLHFAIGSPIANRSRIETENIVGCFINTVAFRSDVSGVSTLRELLVRVRHRTLSAFENQDLPFEKLIEALVPAKGLSKTPLFQAMYSYENFPSAVTHLPGLKVTDLDEGLKMTKIELTFTVGEQDGTFHGHLEYDLELYTHARMQRLTAFVQRVLEAMVNEPMADPWNWSLLELGERDRVLGWSVGGSVGVRAGWVWDWFSEAAAAGAKATALHLDEGEVSYGELQAWAERIAGYLRGRGVGPECRVGVLLERGVGLYASMLGIWRAGGVYVPLDTAYPEERLAYMAEDADLSVLLVEKSTAGRAPAGRWERVDCAVAMACDAVAGTAAAPLAEQLAYILYTSGSTGRPKGVGVSHGALRHQVQWIVESFGLGAADRFLQKASISFDSSLGEILGPLVSGGSLVVAGAGGEYDVNYLGELIARAGVSCVDLTPSLLGALLEAGRPEAWSAVRLVISGGESLKPELVRSFRARSGARLLNAYGPTEATVQAVWSGDLEGLDGVPIGRPLDRMQSYVLDGRMALVPVGTRGELFLGGAGLARGYLGRPALTAERFVPSPFGPPGARLYRTGDQVRWREDGQLEFLGRVDHQVKLRGYRIELDEIERVLEEHPDVREAAVMVREDQPGNPYLAAYLVPANAKDDVLLQEMRKYAAESLPAYMRPAVYLPIKSLPLTVNGKINKSALPAPDATGWGDEAFRAPVGDLEIKIAALFGDVLKRERVGRDQSFFDLGGHSLLAVQLLSRIRKVLSRDFRLVDLFTHPTVEAIASFMKASQWKLPPLISRARDSQTLVPLSFAQKGIWFLAQMDGGGLAYHMPLGILLRGDLNVEALQRAFHALVARHEILRTSFPLVNGAPVQEIAPQTSSRFELEQLDLGHAVLKQMEAAIQARIEQPFNIKTGPLLRATLMRIGVNDNALLVVVHHIIADGWSVEILGNELLSLYRAFRQHAAYPLPPMVLQYADFTLWQHSWLSGDLLNAQKEFWTNSLRGAPVLLELPLDHPRPPRQDFQGSFVGFELDKETTSALRRLAQAHSATLYMVVLTGWALLLSRLSGQTEVVIGTPTMNREQREIEGLIGLFINTLALRIDLGEWPTVSEQIARVKATFLSAQEHAYFPLEEVVAAVNPPRSAAFNPLFQVLFVWQSRLREEGESWPGLSVEGLELPEARSAKFDLLLSLQETEETIQGGIEYATSLFERATVDRFVNYLRQLLTAMASGPSQTAASLPLLGEEQHRTVLKWGEGDRLSEQEIVLPLRLFERQAALTPNAVAVVDGQRSLRYKDLNERANRLARYLRLLGVRAEERVAICVKRNVGMVTALLAVHKAGGAYVPLDPSYPGARLAAMLKDCEPCVLVTENGLLRAPEIQPDHIVSLDDPSPWSGLEATDFDLPLLEADSKRLAYLIYTSGTTGLPKGVMIEQRNLANFIAWADRTFSARQSARMLAATSLSFDLAVYELFLPLVKGGTIQLVENVLALTHTEVPASLVNTVPSALEAVLEAVTLPPHVQTVNLAGEPLTPSLVERVFARSSVDSIYNLYGPTETTTYSTGTQVLRGETFRGEIGRPIANTNVYVLDRSGALAPPGVAGQLYIAGAGVARGYFRQASLTAQKFGPDPFKAGQRMYAAGDLARWRNDGSLEYLGRVDHQVKLRGYRIELGEVERVLEQHPGVQRAIASVYQQPSGERQLIAYVVGQQELTGSLLQAHVGLTLPTYMVPAAILCIDALPVTRNGKLDRSALPEPHTAASAEAQGGESQGDLETTIARVFAEVLQRNVIGRAESFFDLGGHSLLAIRLVNTLERELSMPVAPVLLLETPTVRDLARRLTEMQARLTPPSLPSGVAQLRDGDGAGNERIFFLHPIGGKAFCYLGLTASIPLRYSIFALEADAESAMSPEDATVESIATHYVDAVRKVQPRGPYRLAGWSFGGLLAWEMAEQFEQMGETVAFLGMMDTHLPEMSGEIPTLPALVEWIAEDLVLSRGRDPNVEREFGDAVLLQKAPVQFLANLLERQGLGEAGNCFQEAAKLVAVYGQNAAAFSRYTPRPRVQTVAYCAAAESLDGGQDFPACWERLTFNRVQVYPIEGNHYSIMREPAIGKIARIFAAQLEKRSSDVTMTN